MASDALTAETNWPRRTWSLAILGALVALGIQQLGDLPDQDWDWGRRLVSALILFLGIGSVAFGLAWQKARLIPAIMIALLCGIVAGGVFLWSGVPDDLFGSVGWHLVCGVIAAAFILTLFQAAQDSGQGWPKGWSVSALQAWRRAAIRYPQVHGHLWTNALLIGLSCLFGLIVFGIAHLMAEMFWLVKLDFLRVLLRKDWFNAILCGASFGAALGLLRDRGAIISAMQRVALLVLRVLAPVVAVGIFIFLVALPFTGLAPLWETGETTPIMLVGAMLALFLANAVVDDTERDESRSIILSSSAAALGLFLLPMVGIAAFSSGLRIQQYGLSPDRLWALVFIIVASITAIAYAVAILGPRGWFARLRRTNLHLVFVMAGITLLLSTPLVGFERVATAHQLSRLAGGQVSPEAFDYKSLWFDNGPSGRAAIEQLATRSSDATIRRYATQVKRMKSKWDEAPNAGAAQSGAPLDRRLTILPSHIPLDEAFRARLVRTDACGERGNCTLRYVPGQDFAIIVAAPAPKCDRCTPTIRVIKREKGIWSSNSFYIGEGGNVAAKVAAIRAGRIEMRPVQQRQLFIDGEPAGEPMMLENATAP